MGKTVAEVEAEEAWERANPEIVKEQRRRKSLDADFSLVESIVGQGALFMKESAWKGVARLEAERDPRAAEARRILEKALADRPQPKSGAA